MIPGCTSGFPPPRRWTSRFISLSSPAGSVQLAAFPHLTALLGGQKHQCFVRACMGTKHKGFFPPRGCITSSIPVSSSAPPSLILLLLGADKHPAEGCQVPAVPWVLGISARVASRVVVLGFVPQFPVPHEVAWGRELIARSPCVFIPGEATLLQGTRGACGMGTAVHRASDRDKSLLPTTFQ